MLLVNGRDDFQVPLAEQQRYFALIGTPADRKKVLAARLEFDRAIKLHKDLKAVLAKPLAARPGIISADRYSNNGKL